MLPATLLYIPVLPCFLFFLFAVLSWEDFIFAAQISIAVWLTLLATGAFASISYEKQMGGIGGTFVLGYILCIWMWLFLMFFGSSPLWTTVPIAFAFLLASRLRAGYWLREITTWRSRLIPLSPVFVAILAVLVALPFVRVYSVPYASWTQIETHLVATPAHHREQLLQTYTGHRDFARTVFSGQILNEIDEEDRRFAKFFCLRFMPWEEARRERILRLQIIASLVESDNLSDRWAVSIRDFCVKMNEGFFTGFDGVWGAIEFELPREE